MQQNIGAFGGNPNNVTLFGQSAGSGSEGILMAAPAARGLFHKAIMESGTPGHVSSKERAIEVSRAYLKAAGVSNMEGLLKLSMIQMREAQRRLFETNPEDFSFRPVMDGIVLSELPMKAIAAGHASSVPILLGTNVDEIRLWITVFDMPIDQKPPRLLEKQIEGIVGPRAREVIETYRHADKDYGDAVIHLLTDIQVRMPSIRLAEVNSPRQPTYMYLFTYRSTSTYKKFGSAHGMEIPFVFGVIDALDAIVFTGRGPQREVLMNQVEQAWTNFARSGDPGQPGLPWPKYEAKTRATMELGMSCRVLNDPKSAERAVWAGVLFDGLSPSEAQMSALFSENGTP